MGTQREAERVADLHQLAKEQMGMRVGEGLDCGTEVGEGDAQRDGLYDRILFPHLFHHYVGVSGRCQSIFFQECSHKLKDPNIYTLQSFNADLDFLFFCHKSVS